MALPLEDIKGQGMEGDKEYIERLGAVLQGNMERIMGVFENAISEDVAVAKAGGGTRTLHIKNGLIVGYTDS